MATTPIKTADTGYTRGGVKRPEITRPERKGEGHQGWANWETWHTMLLIDNEPQSYQTKINVGKSALKYKTKGVNREGDPFNIERVALQCKRIFAPQGKETLEFARENERQYGEGWKTDGIDWVEIAEDCIQEAEEQLEWEKKEPARATELRVSGSKKPTKLADIKAAKELEKKAEEAKEAGFNFWIPGQVLQQFQPELLHEIVDYPNENNSPMIQDVDVDESKVSAADPDAEAGVRALESMYDRKTFPQEKEGEHKEGYASTKPSGVGLGLDGKPTVLEGTPLRKEWNIRGPMFSDEFYSNYPGVPGKYLAASKDWKKKCAAKEDQKVMLADFLKKVMGEIAVTFAAAFKVTSRPIQLDKIPGTGEINLSAVENSVNNWPFYAGEVGGRIKFLLEEMNDSDIQDAINDAWAQAAVWHDGSGSGNFTYEVFVRAESIDTDSMTLKYKFVTGTKGE